MGRILSNAMKDFVVNSRKISYSQHVKAVYYKRIQRYVKESLEDLALLAEKLPEKQQARIFNLETLDPFITALFPLGDIRQFKEESKQRILRLCLSVLGLPWQTLADWIDPELAWVLRQEERNWTIAGIKTILYTSARETCVSPVRFSALKRASVLGNMW